MSKYLLPILYIFIYFSTIAQVPVLSGATPNSGIPGDRITVNGINLESISGVSFGTVQALLDSMAYINAGKFTILIPQTTLSGNVILKVTTSDGSVSNAIAFNIVPRLPQIISVKPTSGEIDDIITISGVYINTISGALLGTTALDAALISIIGHNLVAMPVPPVPNTGVFDLILQNVYGNSKAYGSNVNYKFTVTGLNLPKIVSIHPTTGLQGAYVTIVGYDFATIIGIGFGNMLADISTLKILNDTTISIKTPFLGLGANNVTIYSVRGESIPVPYTVLAPGPTITEIFPLNTRIGSTVTIFGANFITLNKVEIGGVSTPGFNVLSNKTMSLLIPNKVPPKAKIKITTAYGEFLSVEELVIDTTISSLPKSSEISQKLLYPNPARDVLYLSPDHVARLIIYNAQGKAIFEKPAYESICNIDVRNWNRGMYVVISIEPDMIQNFRFALE